mgnify:FL=1
MCIRDSPYSLDIFRALWILVVVSYVVVTSFTLMIDTETARRCWFQGVFFPGVVSLLIIIAILYPPLFGTYVPDLMKAIGVPVTEGIRKAVVLFIYSWLTLSRVVAWLAKVVETRASLKWLAPVMIYTAGYGPLLSAITVNAYLKELRGAETKWEKTEKSGQVMLKAR